MWCEGRHGHTARPVTSQLAFSALAPSRGAMLVWLLLAVTSVVSGASERGRILSRETRLQYARTIASSVLSRTPPGAQLIGVRGDVPPLEDRLVHNATVIRRNIVDTFRCNDRVYGYYADLDNDCQIFHICVPMQQLFPDLYDLEDIFHFSFICPGFTIFSQDSMTCNWEDWAFPCPQAPQLYHRNNHFFVVPAEDVQKTSSTPKSIPASQTPLITPTSSPASNPNSNSSNHTFSSRRISSPSRRRILTPLRHSSTRTGARSSRLGVAFRRSQGVSSSKP